jgi:hypothetical protein
MRIATLPGTDASPERHRPNRLAAVLQRATALGRDTVRWRASTWRAFASDAPQYVEAELRKERGSWEKHGAAYTALFPRVSGRRARPRLSLSSVDEMLLGLFSQRQPRSVVDALRRTRTRPAVMELIELLGDAFIAYRAGQWATRGALRVGSADAPLNAFSTPFARTPFANRLLAQGLEALGDAPPVFVGGHQAYGEPGWAVRRTSRGLRLQRL